MQFRPNDILHFHIINFDRKCASVIYNIRSTYVELKVNISSELHETWHNPVYYACNRFLIVSKLLNFYSINHIYTIDADSRLLHDLSNSIPTSENYDFCCFTTGRCEPASVFQATLMMFSKTTLTERFLNILRIFLFAKLNRPKVFTWMLDQAALYSVKRML